MLRKVWDFRELLYTLVRRDLIVRYQSSVLGFFWSFAKPLALMVIFTLAFKVILKIKMPNPDVPFSLHMLIGVMVWSFLARAIFEGHGAILGHANLIKKVKLPVEVFPATTVLGNVINFFLAMLVVFPVVIFIMSGKQGFSAGQIILQILLFLLLTGLVTLLSYGLTLLVSAINVFYRDMESITDVGLQAWFYATPIVYPASLLYEGEGFARIHPQFGRVLETLYWLNPMAPIMVAYRRVLLYRQPFLEVPDQLLALYLGVAVLTSALIYGLAQWLFNSQAPHFADEV